MSNAAMNAYLNSQTEAQIQKAICGYLDVCRIVYSVTDSSLYFVDGKARRKVKADGFPDLVCCVNSRFVGIEVKSHSGKLRPAQIEMHKRIRDAGGVVVVARSIDDVAKCLQTV
jgi:hypothetical protein